MCEILLPQTGLFTAEAQIRSEASAYGFGVDRVALGQIFS